MSFNVTDYGNGTVQTVLALLNSSSSNSSSGTGNNSTFSQASSDVSRSSAAMQVLRIFVLVTGVIGVLANGLITAVMAVSKQLSKERVNILVLNQTVLDFVSSVMLTVIYSLRLCNIYLTGPTGYFLCMFFLDEMLLWIGLNGSTANLVIIGVERYLMIVHPIWHKNHVKNRIIYAAVAFTWIDGILLNVPVSFATTGIEQGRCLSYYFWSSEQASHIYGIWYFSYFYVLALVAFVYCYGHILVIVRRRLRSLAPNSAANTVAGNTSGLAAPTAAQLNAQRAELNVIKTMITITVLFILCWLPNSIYNLLTNVTSLWNYDIYFGSLVLAFLNICFNPFIYAGQYHVIRNRLRQICKKGWQFVSGRVMTGSNAIDISVVNSANEAASSAGGRRSHDQKRQATINTAVPAINEKKKDISSCM